MKSIAIKQSIFFNITAKFLGLLMCLCVGTQSFSQDTRNFQVFQFPAHKIPRIDGDSEDWNIVPEHYTVGMDQLWEDSGKHAKADAKNLDVSVKVGWVKGLNRLYILYEAYDDYWDFSLSGLHNDTFELIVDADLSGGPFIDRFHPNKNVEKMDAYFSFHGVHAQNYHIFTPPKEKDWTMVWGSQPWIKDLPYANTAYNYSFKPGEGGKLILEFWITPFDYAGNNPDRAIQSILKEHNNIGLCWAIIDYDDVNKKQNNGFWNLSKEHTMYGNASYSLPFKLMPLEPEFVKAIEAKWTFKTVDMSMRTVAFIDQSIGDINTWKWDFGDGETSSNKNPIHQYKETGLYVVVLEIEGSKGTSKLSKVWDVAVK
tara:strand:+ start:198148 stop:199257 length:1110 start_codon:yes stop_codon:yes gene_type:complete